MLLLTLVLVTGAARAQVDNVYVYGTVKDYVSAKKMDGVVVSVFKNGAKLAEVTTNASGKYEFNLDYSADYKIVYSKQGIISKNITIDTRNIPEEERVGGHAMNIEMTLFQALPGIDFTVLNQPIGKAKFDPITSEVTWDLQYTEQIRSEIARLMKEYEEKKKREAGAEAEYARLMQQGDAGMTAADFKKAVEAYTGALAVKAGDPVATAKLSDARMKFDEADGKRKRDEQYAALIKEADALFAKKDYENAKGKYTSATGVKDEEAYPKQKVKEIDGILAELAKKAEEERKAKELQARYDAAIKAGDAAFTAGRFEEARAPYTEAAGLKPVEKYPKDRLAAIDLKLAELAKKAEEERKAKELQARYDAAIKAGDAAFNAGRFEEAKAPYTEAASLKGTEKYPKDQLVAIDARLAELAKKAEEERKAKELQARYDAAIAAADAAFRKDGFDEAKAKYNEALGLKPAEKYPKDQLAAIDAKLAELARKAEEERKAKELQARYDAAIAAGDAAFQKDGFDQAKAKYNEALGLKPAEKYPKDQLAAIDAKLAELARKAEEERKAKELQARYDAAIAAADAAFQKDGFDQAKAKYNDALGLKPAEKYPKDQLAAIDAKLAELARKAEEERKRKELEARYAELVGRADKSYGAQQWAAALNDYKDALALMPAEAHPKARIADIEQRLDAAAREKAEQERLAREKAELDARYQALVAAGDKAFGTKGYAEARTAYTDALGIKPAEKHPKDRLAEIDRILADKAAQDEATRLAAEKAARDKAAADAAVEEARRRAEEEAARLAAEKAARDRAAADAAAEAARLKADADALERRYRDLVAGADLAFDADRFDRAREKYTEALSVKPSEQYPKDRLELIERELAARAAAQGEAERLAEERRRADEERRRREADEAEAARLAAEADRLKGEQARQLEERYRKTITEADLAFGARSWSEARGLYAQALDIKPSERYPADRMAEIDRLVAEEEARRQAELAARQPRQEPETPRRTSSTIDIRKEQEAEQFMREARLREEAEKYERIKKQRRELTEEEVAHQEQAYTRRQDGVAYKQRIEEGGQQLYQGSEDRRKANAEELAAYRADLGARELERQERAADARSSAQGVVDATVLGREGAERDLQQRAAGSRATAVGQVDAYRDEQAEAARRRSEAQATQVAAQRSTAEQWRSKWEQDARMGADRNQRAREDAVAQAERQVALQQRGAELARSSRDQVQDAKDVQARVGQQLSQRAADQRMAAQEQLDRTPLNQPKDFADYNRSKLASDYPPGVTEESYTEGNKVVIRRVVVNGNKADEYSKVIAKWGTFYFKNGQSITEMIWSNETENE